MDKISSGPALALHSLYCSQGLKDAHYNKKLECSKKYLRYNVWKPSQRNCQNFDKKSVQSPKPFRIAPFRRSATALITKFAFKGSYTKNLFWYQDFDLRRSSKTRWVQPLVHFADSKNCRLSATTRKAMYLTYKMAFSRLQLLISETIMFNCLIWMQRNMLLEFVVT